jgi:hypothetical protein
LNRDAADTLGCLCRIAVRAFRDLFDGDGADDADRGFLCVQCFGGTPPLRFSGNHCSTQDGGRLIECNGLLEARVGCEHDAGNGLRLIADQPRLQRNRPGGHVRDRVTPVDA